MVAAVREYVSDAGIGKRRLLEELESLAKARGIRVLHGRFLEQDRTFSYQGFCEVVQEHFRSKSSASSGEHVDCSRGDALRS
ncbi:MAG: hypothetical protein HYU52_04250 [Acidobacteria bacterium]|nr:hypothetical protein [Acidobacteriota bacterium]